MNKKKTKSRDCKFQFIPHWDDPEIGYKALLRCIRNYVKYKDLEFDRLAPVITRDEFVWDTFSNMCRRNGYPQYDPKKNKGNFYSYVQANCIRNQIDWARKRDTKARQLAALEGNFNPDATGQVEYNPNIQLDQLIEDSDDRYLHEVIEGSKLDGYTEQLAYEEIIKNVSKEKISDKFRLTWKEFATLLLSGWSVVDISKELEVNPTTTRKYLGILKDRMLQDPNIKELVENTL